MSKKNNLVKRPWVKDPSYKIVVIRELTNTVWFFDSIEKELALGYYNRFVSIGLTVKLFERLWKQV